MRKLLKAISLALALLLGILGISGSSVAQESTWTQASPAGDPPPRSLARAAYDVESDRVIVFGGQTNDGTNGETWAYDFNTHAWTNMNPSPAPSPRWEAPMVYHPRADRVILYGGTEVGTGVGFPPLSSETWAYDWNTNSWTDLNPASPPGGRRVPAMAYDVESDRVVLFGGGRELSGLLDTWAYDWDTNTWTDMAPSTRPPHPFGRMTYDSESDRIILFTARFTLVTSTYVGRQTWVYDFNRNNWTNATPVTSPPALDAFGLVYDNANDLAILFGGQGVAANHDETWTYDYNTNAWARVEPTNTPGPRQSHAMAYDSESGYVVLFGGLSPTRDAETWVYGDPLPLSPAFDVLLVAGLVLAAAAVAVVLVFLLRRRRAGREG